jgi:hypothetical protein
MKKRRGVAAKITATLILALGGFTLAAVISGVGFASGETTTASTPSTTTDTTPTTTTTPPTTTQPPSGEGCTPGFWKQDQHFGSWTDPYDPTDPLSSVFSAAALTAAGVDPNKTLLAALQTGGGGVDALLRHAVAAVLNAASPDVDYPFTEAEIIAAVNAALLSGEGIEDLKDELEGANELGCPLGRDD